MNEINKQLQSKKIKSKYDKLRSLKILNFNS